MIKPLLTIAAAVALEISMTASPASAATTVNKLDAPQFVWTITTSSGESKVDKISKALVDAYKIRNKNGIQLSPVATVDVNPGTLSRSQILVAVRVFDQYAINPSLVRESAGKYRIKWNSAGTLRKFYIIENGRGH